MKIFGREFWKQKANGVTINVPVSSGTSYLFGPLIEGFSGAWARHIVTESKENLTKFSPIYACISRVSSDISILRPMLMGPGKGGTTVEITDSRSPYLPLMKRPNPYMNWIQFLERWIVCKLLYGNAYAIKDRDARGIVVALYPVDPRLVKPLIAPDGEVYYQFSGNQLARIPSGEAALEASEVIHDRMCCLQHDLIGVPPIYAAASSGTQAIRIQANSETFFANMSRPSGHLSHPGKIDPEQLKLLKEQFEQNFSAGNLGRTMVTGGDAKYNVISMTAEQSQLVEQLKWAVEDVARCFHVPLHKIQVGAMPTFSNIAALNQQYYDEALKPHIEAFERLMTDEVVMKEEYCVELDLSGLLRMDPSTRAETTKTLVQCGVLSPNEARLTENLPPVTGGEQPLLQQQMWQIGQLANREPPQDAPTNPATPSTPAADPAEDDPEDDDLAKMAQRGAWIEAAASIDLRRNLGMPDQ